MTVAVLVEANSQDLTRLLADFDSRGDKPALIVLLRDEVRTTSHADSVRELNGWPTVFVEAKMARITMPQSWLRCLPISI